jgi:glycosyltransferase involved in cell wall biosynthesis
MKPIKVCMVSLYAYHLFNPEVYSRFGGAELQLYNIAVSLASDPNFDTNFIVGDFGQPASEQILGVKLFKFYNPRRKIKYTGMVLGLIRLWRLLDKIDADIYMQRAAGLETGIVAMFCRVHKKKFVYMVAHDADVSDKIPNWMAGGLLGNIRWKLFRSGLRTASVVIVQHKGQQESLKKNYGKESIIRNSAHFIPEGINVSQKSYVLWVARADDWKQPQLFLGLAKNYPDTKFVMVMPESNDSNYFRKIKSEAQKIPNLEFHDFVAINKIDDFFLGAKIFVNTSSFEGFPNTFIQAAKTKTPILSLTVNPDGMLDKFNLGFCSENNPDKLKSDLKQLLSNPSLCDKIGEHGYEYARNNHDLGKIIEDDKRLLANLAHK